MEIIRDHVNACPAVVQTLDVAGVRVHMLSAAMASSVLWSTLIPELGTGQYVLLLASEHLMLHDTCRPGDEWLTNVGAVPKLMVLIPKALFPLSAAAVEPIIARRLCGSHGVGALTAEFLTRVVTDADRYLVSDAPRLRAILIDLVAATVAHELAKDLASESDLVTRVQDFIRKRLGDDTLCPSLIARAHHISLRHLHRLFESQGSSIAGWIRSCRLERCQRDLADPLRLSDTIQTIACRWGFTDKAHFSRAFRAAYGVPPSVFRQRALARFGTSGQPCGTPRQRHPGRSRAVYPRANAHE